MPRISARVANEAIDEVRGTLASLASFGLFAPADVEGLIARVSVVTEAQAAGALADAAVIFEGVPEVPGLKREVLARISALAGPAAIIASTTSTILVDDLSSARRSPGALPQRALAQSRLSDPAGGALSGARTDPPSPSGSRRCWRASARSPSSAPRVPATSCRASRRSP
jgi:3-hydroxybutyryl-CoA dehydrogenase